MQHISYFMKNLNVRGIKMSDSVDHWGKLSKGAFTTKFTTISWQHIAFGKLKGSCLLKVSLKN